MTESIYALFANRDEHPLFYVESGSRLWGIASSDSDYDVRGFHLQPKEKFFDFKKHPDIIEIMDADFDFVSYDLDKMFGLLAKSNPTVFDWIRSDLIYLNNLPQWEEFQRQVVANYDFRALYHHYFSLARGNMTLLEREKKFTYKTAFYCIRGLLSAELAAKKIVPDLRITELFERFDPDNPVVMIAQESLARKMERREREEVEPARKSSFLKAIKSYTGKLSSGAPEGAEDQGRLGVILRDYNFALKEKYYG